MIKKIINKYRSHIQDFSYYSASQAYAQVLTFISLFFIARYLGPINLGIYAFVQNFSALFFTFVSGLDFYFSWHLNRSENKIDNTLAFVKTKSALILIILIVGVILSYITLPSDVFALTAITFFTYVFTVLSPFWYYALSHNKAKLVATAFALGATVVFIGKIITVLLELDLKAFVILSSLDGVIVNLLLAIYFLRDKQFKERLWHIYSNSKLNIMEVLNHSKYSIVYTFFWMLKIRSDQLILPALTGAATLGVYNAAVKISEIPNIILTILSMTIYGRLQGINDSNIGNYKRGVKRAIYVYMAIALLATIIIIIFAPFLVQVIFGDKFIGADDILRLYALSIPALFISTLFSNIYGARDWLKYLSYISIIISIITVLIVYLLIQAYGAMGGALATVITYTLAAITLYAFWRYKLNKS